jgi:hypothetical protein
MMVFNFVKNPAFINEKSSMRCVRASVFAALVAETWSCNVAETARASRLA